MGLNGLLELLKYRFSEPEAIPQFLRIKDRHTVEASVEAVDCVFKANHTTLYLVNAARVISMFDRYSFDVVVDKRVEILVGKVLKLLELHGVLKRYNARYYELVKEQWNKGSILQWLKWVQRW